MRYLLDGAHDLLLRKGLKISHLRLLAAFLQAGQLGLAAQALNISQPAASRLLGEIQKIVGVPVHAPTGRSMHLTPAGEALANRAQRILIELRDAARDIEGITEGTTGTIRIGSVTGPAIEHLLPALLRAGRDMPMVSTEVTVAPSDQISEQLLAGQLDVAIGRLPGGRARALMHMDPIGDEPVDLMVRRGHPLLRDMPLAAKELEAFDWVMPGADSLLGRTVFARLAHYGLMRPRQRLSTTSFLLTMAMLQHSDAIAPIARAVARNFTGGPQAPFATLDIDLGITVETFGLITVADRSLTPLVRRFVALMLGRGQRA